MNFRLNKNTAMFQHLKRIRNAGWNAIIAGGAIRDTYHDKRVSTIDVFVKAQKKAIKEMGIEFKSPKWMQYWFNMFKCSAKHQDDVIYLGDIETFEKLDRNIIAVWQVITKGKTYQIILITKDPEKYVEDNFDFGICKAFYDGTKMRFTNDFLMDSLNHTITLYREHLTDKQIEYAVTEHVHKIKKKYPGWVPVL